MTRKFIPCIYLYQEKAVKDFTDFTVIHEDPVAQARLYSEKNSDELIVFDLSTPGDDTAHDKALDIIKDICASVEVDVIGSGNIKRMEDVKKLLYAGCKKVILDYSLESNVDVTEEVSLKFGKDKMIAMVNSAEMLTVHQGRLEQFVSSILVQDSHIISSNHIQLDLPYIVMLSEAPLAKIIELLSKDTVYGITGNIMNDNIDNILSLKELCMENGIPVETLEPKINWSELKKNSDGMVPVIVQDYITNEVLMLAYMNEEAYLQTMKTGKMNYYSRSRNELWLKGETSGHYQYVKSLTADCDLDTILAKVSQVGVACHTGARSCFFREIVQKEYETTENPLKVFEDVLNVIKDRKIHPKEGSYTNYLFDKGIDKILKKLGEEATEIVIAAKNPNSNEVKYEISDFLYHMMVLMVEKDVTWEEITKELANR